MTDPQVSKSQGVLQFYLFSTTWTSSDLCSRGWEAEAGGGGSLRVKIENDLPWRFSVCLASKFTPCMQARLLFYGGQVCEEGGQRCGRGAGGGQQLSLHPCHLLYCLQDGTGRKYSSCLSFYRHSCLRLTLIKMRVQELTATYVKQEVWVQLWRRKMGLIQSIL